MNNTDNLDENLEKDGNDTCDCSEDNCECNERSIQQSDEISKALEDKTKQCEEYLNLLQRTAAEFDNYKKRTAREKEALYTEAVCDVIAAILPVVDNFERALLAAEKGDDKQSLKDGIEMVFRQMKDALKGIGVEEIEGAGQSFDPNLHNAVMHVEDDSVGENTIVEEFQKGYSYKGKVVRHSMVKVAN